MELQVDFNTVLYPLTQALALSLVVERVLEVGKNLIEPLLGPKTTRAVPPLSETRQAVQKLEGEMKADHRARQVEEAAEAEAEERKKDVARLHELRKELASADRERKAEILREIDRLKKGDEKNGKKGLLAREDEGELDERVPTWTILTEDATDPDDGTTLKIFTLQFFGFAIGILLAHFAHIQLFNALLTTGQLIPTEVDYIFTGLLIGGGSAPMHALIRFATERKVPAPELDAAELEAGEEQPAPPEAPRKAPAVVKSPPPEELAGWQDIHYLGGVNREKLEHVHRRAGNPDLIVYHHTAMNSGSTFEDVVRVIESKDWVTGYNCVILADGSIRPFCRWDRFGNHAVGFNRRSLGIAFNGNFETDPTVPFSNPDGRMGLTRPTEVQLKAAARVVTLWTFLYSIAVDFDDQIIPHNRISSKACPGSQFPYDEFRRLIEHYRKKWEESEQVQERLEEFKLKPYLFV